MHPGVGMDGLRRVGEGTPGIAEEWIPVTIAAATGRHILALSQGLEAAGHHGRSHVLTAKFTRRSRRCHRDEGQRAQRRDRRNAGFQKLFHVGLAVLVYWS